MKSQVFEVSREGDLTIVRVPGNISTHDEIEAFKEALQIGVKGCTGDVAIDLSEASYISSLAIGQLIKLYKGLSNRNCRLLVRGLNADLYAIFTTFRLNEHIVCEEEKSEAR